MSFPRTSGQAVATWAASWPETGTTNGARPCRFSRNCCSSHSRAVSMVRYMERRSSALSPRGECRSSACLTRVANPSHLLRPWFEGVEQLDTSLPVVRERSRVAGRSVERPEGCSGPSQGARVHRLGPGDPGGAPLVEEGDSAPFRPCRAVRSHDLWTRALRESKVALRCGHLRVSLGNPGKGVHSTSWASICSRFGHPRMVRTGQTE